ncbi:TPA: hypothetical protein QCI56_000792 [Enterobacter asburiae]|uniref:Uncharacterized protein n=1 Tax=Enterobacter asburiae TaxID=61645 RepID=A0A455VQU9_ENTAS|nr:hypothetical protein [Enterobacter asburiae]MBJ3780045.1 hypothetical protein [Enterobacter asburiae]BBI95797.1 hypothetical protein MRY18106EAS_23290 [Enterobacter asburiae]HDR2659914.1 hypothetical protein [Enterobacter asburiae]
MANFLVRVELYDASSDHYDALYEKMSNIGFYKGRHFFIQFPEMGASLHFRGEE